LFYAIIVYLFIIIYSIDSIHIKLKYHVVTDRCNLKTTQRTNLKFGIGVLLIFSPSNKKEFFKIRHLQEKIWGCKNTIVVQSIRQNQIVIYNISVWRYKIYKLDIWNSDRSNVKQSKSATRKDFSIFEF